MEAIALDHGRFDAITEKNVLDSDGTLIISRGSPTGGTDYTRKMALKHGKQLLHIDLSVGQRPSDAGSLIASWIEMNRIETLNVAGPRASSDSEIYDASRRLIVALLSSQA